MNVEGLSTRARSLEGESCRYSAEIYLVRLQRIRESLSMPGSTSPASPASGREDRNVALDDRNVALQKATT